MSEPTSDGNQKPDPDPQPEPDQGKGENQEQTSGSDFSDPTAPVWADPTAPVPASPAPEVTYASAQDTPPDPPVPPAPPGGAYTPYGQQPATTPPPPAAPPMSNPYAQRPPMNPYGQPTGQYGQPQPGQQYPGYGQSPYGTGAPTESNVSAIILTIVSGVSMLGTFFLIGIPSLVFGIMALTSNSTDPIGSRKKARTGWIIFAINAGVVALVIVIAVIGLFALSGGGSSNFDSGY